LSKWAGKFNEDDIEEDTGIAAAKNTHQSIQTITGRPGGLEATDTMASEAREGISKIPAGQLQPGMVLSATGATVLSGPEAGVRTPSGKVELTIKTRSGVRRSVTWGKHTKIGVRSAE